jgi:hypothetical protein
MLTGVSKVVVHTNRYHVCCIINITALDIRICPKPSVGQIRRPVFVDLKIDPEQYPVRKGCVAVIQRLRNGAAEHLLRSGAGDVNRRDTQTDGATRVF